MSNSVRYPVLEAHPVAWTVGKLIIASVITVFIIAAFAMASFLLNESPRAPGFPTPPAPRTSR